MICHYHHAAADAAGTPLWKLILKQFDDLLVKVGGAHRDVSVLVHCLVPMHCPVSCSLCTSSTPHAICSTQFEVTCIVPSLSTTKDLLYPLSIPLSCPDVLPPPLQILIAAAVIDLVIAFTNGESFLSALVEPAVIVLILIINGECPT